MERTIQIKDGGPGTADYFTWLKSVRARYQRFWSPFCSPYEIDGWVGRLTPIEFNVWQDIRYIGLPFYPQWPVDRYFVDFGEPLLKIAIEVDGRQWHLDTDRDARRTECLERLGWTVHRILGSQTMKTREDYFPDDEDRGRFEYEEEHCARWNEFLNNTSEGILLRLFQEHGDFWEHERHKVWVRDAKSLGMIEELPGCWTLGPETARLIAERWVSAAGNNSGSNL